MSNIIAVPINETLANDLNGLKNPERAKIIMEMMGCSYDEKGYLWCNSCNQPNECCVC